MTLNVLLSEAKVELTLVPFHLEMQSVDIGYISTKFCLYEVRVLPNASRPCPIFWVLPVYAV